MEAETGRLLAPHANRKLVQQQIRDQGVEVTLKDLHNIKARTRPQESSHLHSLLAEMQKEVGAVTELVVTTINELVAISYQDTKMRQAQARFPELLLLDATYKLNDMRMPLYVLVVVDGNGESVVICLWMVANEERATISGLMDIFVRNNDTANIKCVMADKDMTERDVIRDKLPGAAIHICLFHVLRTFRREVTTEKLGIRSDERLVCLEILQKMAYAAGEVEYAKLYVDLQQTRHPAVMTYFDANWHTIREQWVEGLKLRQRSFLTRTNNRVESINQKLKSVITKFSNIVTFFKDLKVSDKKCVCMHVCVLLLSKTLPFLF